MFRLYGVSLVLHKAESHSIDAYAIQYVMSSDTSFNLKIIIEMENVKELIELKAMMILACKLNKEQLIIELTDLVNSINSASIESRNIMSNEAQKELLIDVLNVIERYYDVEFGNIDNAVSYILAKINSD